MATKTNNEQNVEKRNTWIVNVGVVFNEDVTKERAMELVKDAVCEYGGDYDIEFVTSIKAKEAYISFTEIS